LVLALAHHIDSDGAQNKHVDQAGHSHRCHWQKGVETVLGCHETRDSKGLSTARSGQGDHHWQCSLQGEIDREDGGLQTSELGPRESAEGNEASDK
jgi:hypothetical protein